MSTKKKASRKPAEKVKAPSAKSTRRKASGTVDVSTPEKFSLEWNASPSLTELVERTGKPSRTLTGRAAAYRKRGIPLKFFRVGGHRNTDWEAIKKKVAADNAAREGKRHTATKTGAPTRANARKRAA